MFEFKKPNWLLFNVNVTFVLLTENLVRLNPARYFKKPLTVTSTGDDSFAAEIRIHTKNYCST